MPQIKETLDHWHDILTLIYKNRVEKIAKAKGISMAQLSLAWIMSQKGMFIIPFVVLVNRCNPLARRNGTHCWNDLS